MSERALLFSVIKMEKELVYIGKDSTEEYYIKLKDGSLTGWSFMGLRPETEDKLREYKRETDPADLGYEIPSFMSSCFDWNKWADMMEEDWLESHDSQGEYERDGETYYLGFGSGTDIFHFFKTNNITDYKSFVNVFEEVNLVEEEFKELVEIMELYKKDKKKGYSKFITWQEKISEFPLYIDEKD